MGRGDASQYEDNDSEANGKLPMRTELKQNLIVCKKGKLLPN